MLDIRYLREHREDCLDRLSVRGDPELPHLVDRALELDRRRRDLIADVEALKAERNRRSREIGERKRTGEDAGDVLARMQEVAAQIRTLDAELSEAEAALESLLLTIPNLPGPRVLPGEEGEGEVVFDAVLEQQELGAIP